MKFPHQIFRAVGKDNPLDSKSDPARKRLAFCLGVVLPLMRLTRASAEENDASYRHQFYREDNNRIEVDTDSAHFDVGLGAQLRLTGDLAVDAISGATPTGAPPQAQWPFPTFNDLYQNAYGQAYSGQFNRYVTDNQIYVDAGYETYQQMTNLASLFAQSTAPTIATNSANSSFHTLTNSANFRNTTVPLTQMHDHRVAFSLGLPITIGDHLLTPSFSSSEESDYISRSGSLNDSISLNNKNTTINLGWSYNGDSVRDDMFVWQKKNSYDVLVGVVQLLGPKSYLTVNLTHGNESGYLSDPYRGVMAATNFFQTNPDDAALSPEKRPLHRSKEIFYVSWLGFIDPLNGSVECGYRLFHDSYGINAHTAELGWNQKIGNRLVISPSFRYYYQTAADFYYVTVPDFNHFPAFYSADYRLSELQSLTYGIKVTYRVFSHLSVDAGYTRYIMEGLDGVTSRSAYPSANIISIGGRLWF